MTDQCRSWWRNCALDTDPEMRAIDILEDDLQPIDAKATKIRELISTFELCHHKAERWVTNIIEAIGKEESNKGLGTRPADHQHPAETVWQNACAALSAWCAGCPVDLLDQVIGEIPAAELLNSIGKRSRLKEWQIQRVIEKIRSIIHWPQPANDPAVQYVWLVLNVGDYDATSLDQCPERYKEHKDFWLQTVSTTINDTENGDETTLSLGFAIDMLWPCHWRFVDNLQFILEAIGGNCTPATSFAACGRNINLVPTYHRMETICHTLKKFCNPSVPEEELDKNLLAVLGTPSPVKKWLTASLDKTIRLQMHPPDKMRKMLSDLANPTWYTAPQ
ncbi:MAG: hypothetical protein FVQ81_08545 [Candidatus Glassbacteria bacterium]|nr:hypothetical protein [Candidatus Glassbacteria bacterium]